ncbi:PTS transporter subunit EIIC [Lapidilactobacillus wuchangensis]|uniref:PTS transporter subunit EIIC n=1 Tax=Lapidilactobacillus wuchangensis TaxID=2486001 RepID=UPI000F79100A|nr:PTS transporter subunit EIIC [Lapidilactobacillus wuchangensis]
MSTNLKKTATNMIEKLGGQKNIKLVTHCVTRLRFSLLDPSLVDEIQLKELPEVMGIMKQQGQFQIIIGPTKIDSLYSALEQQLDQNKLAKVSSKIVQTAHKNWLQQGLTVFADIFIPILPVIVGAGVLLGIGNVLTAPGIFGATTLIQQFPQFKGLTEMIIMVANTAFTYIPVLVCWSATKRFGGNPALGIVLGLVLINSQLLPSSEMSGVFSGKIKPVYWDIFGLKIQQIGYQNSVLPPLLAALLLVQLEKLLKRYLPNILQSIVVAPLAIFVTAFFTFLVIGPVTNQLASWITDPLTALFKYQPLIAGLIFGLLWEPLVVSGLHYALIAFNIQQIAATQQSQMIAIIATICMAEAGADLAMVLLTKHGKKRSLALSATISSLLGVTEPSMFGVTIPNRYPFICVMGSAGLAGLLVAWSQEYAISAGPAGPLSLVIIPVQYWGIHGLIMLITLLSGFLSTFICGYLLNRKRVLSEQPVSINQ